MRIDTGQQMQLSQQMKLAPRMIQSMEILQLPQQALEARIEQEMASNPTLELVEPSADESDLRQTRDQAERDDREPERELRIGEDQGGQSEDFERLSNIIEELGENWAANDFETGESFARRQTNAHAGLRDAKMDALANTAARGPSLYEQLCDQWRTAEVPEALREAGDYLISRMDADGYLREPMHELIHHAPDGIDQQQLDAALALLKGVLDPPGLAAANLRECLLLQIDAKKRQDPQLDLGRERRLVSDFLKELENNQLPRIARTTGWSIDAINQAKANLRHLCPHPGRLLCSEDIRALTPDILVEYEQTQNRYTVQLARHRMPALQINESYLAMAASAAAPRETRDFVKNNVRNARWLIDAISQRSATLLRVASVVVDTQQAFFEQGPAALKPLPMTGVAEQLGIHVATVSRAVSEKYMQTPRGIFPLRMFFSGGLDTEQGKAMSWQAVQARLQALVDQEDKGKPLNDDDLADALVAEGIVIARRTVSKYRQQLGIPTAQQRREYVSE